MTKIKVENRYETVRIDALESIDGKATIDDLGILRGMCPVTRCGIFLYHNDDGSERRELRPADEVFAPHSMKSLEMIPITLEHPAEGYVDATVASREAIGATGESVKRSGDLVYASIVVYDKAAVEEIRSKRTCELSLGYVSEIEHSPGVYEGEPYDCIQRKITYNHLSVVSEGRAGSDIRIRTDSGVFMNRNDEQEIPRDAQLKAPITPQVLNEQFEQFRSRTDSRMDAIEKSVDSMRKDLKEVMDSMHRRRGDEEEEVMDGEEAERKKKLHESTERNSGGEEKTDSASVHAEAARRAKYMLAAKEHLDSEKFASLAKDSVKTNDIRDAVLLHLDTAKSVLESKSSDYVDAVFDTLMAVRTRTNQKEKVHARADVARSEGHGSYVMAADRPVATIKFERG